MKRLNQAGSHVVALLFGLLVVGVIGFAGYTVMQRGSTDDTASTATTATTTKAPTKIESKADLTQASKALDDTASSVDSSLNDNSLNSDLNDLL